MTFTRYRPSAMELRLLKALRDLGGVSNEQTIGEKMALGSAMTNYLCRWLTEKGLLDRVGRRWAINSTGQRALEEAFYRVLNILKNRELVVTETLAKIKLP